MPQSEHLGQDPPQHTLLCNSSCALHAQHRTLLTPSHISQELAATQPLACKHVYGLDKRYHTTVKHVASGNDNDGQRY